MLELIGAGFSRTGTSSLKRALELLGYAPCYHMHEVFMTEGHSELWARAAQQEPDWQSLFKDFRAALDAPTCHYWQQIHRAFPSSKVILSVRDADDWYESYKSTIFKVLSNISDSPKEDQATLNMVKKLELDGVFEGRFEDKAFAVEVYNKHNQFVQDSLSDEDLLVYEVSEGWESLCRFLGQDIPTEAFPNKNTRAQFQARVEGN